MAAASRGITERIAARTPAGALPVEAEASGAELRTGDAVPAQAPRAVARLEDVMSGAPAPASPTSPEVEVKLPVDEPDAAQAPRQVARLEDVLSIAPPPAPEVREVEPAREESPDAAAEVDVQPITEAPPPTRAEMRALAPRYVAAHALRAAFLFEQTAAFESRIADEEPVVETPAPETSVAPPAPVSQTVSVPPPVVEAQAEASEPVPADSHNHWLAVLCLLALVALVIILTGRNPRRPGKTG